MALQHVLLALLSKKPNTGYGLGRLLRRELAHLWDARLQQIYAELAKLEARSLVSAEKLALPNRPSKKVYSLTPEGEALLEGWLLARPAPPVAKDELLVQLYCLDGRSRESTVRRLEERLDDATREAELLAGEAARADRTDPGRLGQLLTIEAARARAEAEASWCARAITVLREDVAGAPAATRAQRKAAPHSAA